jgi:hypothetical protein
MAVDNDVAAAGKDRGSFMRTAGKMNLREKKRGSVGNPAAPSRAD